MGGKVTKIKIKGYLKNITNNEKTEFSTTAIKDKNKYKYIINNEKYILNIIDNKIILNRNNDEAESTMYFEKNKKIPCLYTLKTNNITIEIDILTNDIKIDNNNIKILYTIIDSNIIYEYNIEMSE